ncbi:SprT family protein [Chengkuizengella axinellae]|uniref:Protein SprT-like n=1 Tax=Chengkuizengella axinellae TaxID=3064388 RepID=A0ABT9J3W1_9BACL|nr:SprT family protein [Chengkuizengella sp. 2205SS18-9]MDP5276316.1 SprT family protein [Chengkuizengella sp. 2205SS18-9]
MDDKQLQSWIEQISLQFFGRPFLHKATFNRRLRATGGRYFIKSHNIDISWQYYHQFGKEETEKVIKHELCHYHLHLLNRGYKHRDADFKQLLKEVGGTRYCRPLNDARAKKAYRYQLTCLKCGTTYLRKRKMDVSKYVCGKCKGKLKLIPLDYNQKT